jgi:hypothetical protein
MRKFKANQEQIAAALDMLKNIKELREKEADFNLYVVNTPKGQIKVKSSLPYEEFIEELKKKKSIKKQ